MHLLATTAAKFSTIIKAWPGPLKAGPSRSLVPSVDLLQGILVKCQSTAIQVGARNSVRCDQMEDKTFQVHKGVVYFTAHGVGCILDVYTPTRKSNGLGIVHVMNGGWHSDEYMVEHFDKDFRLFDHFASLGFTVFSVWTGSCERFSCDEMTTHVKLAVDWVQEHADEHRIDPTRLGVTGASSGGQLALMAVLSTTIKVAGEKERQSLDTNVAAMGLMFPVTDLTWRSGKLSRNIRRILFQDRPMERSEKEAVEEARKLSPLHHEGLGSLPPLFIVQGDADVFFQSTMDFVDTVHRSGGRAELVVVPNAGHNWPTMDEEVKQMAKWFDVQLR